MKRNLRLLFLILLLPALLCPQSATARRGNRAAKVTTITGAKVYYSFDHYANNPKVSRTYISGDMMRAANASSLLRSTPWDLSKVTSEITSLLSLHTHSQSTTGQVMKDLVKVHHSKNYEEYMNVASTTKGTKLMVYCHLGRNNVIEELLIFRFRSNYCSRVVQITGKLKKEDIGRIIHKNL